MVLVASAWINVLFFCALSYEEIGAAAERYRYSPLSIGINVIALVAFLICWPGSIWLWFHDRRQRPSSWLWLVLLVPLGLFAAPIFIIRNDARWRKMQRGASTSNSGSRQLPDL